MPSLHNYGRERRRRPTVAERRALFELWNGRCQNCGDPLGADYHNAHLAGFSNGRGSTNMDNIVPQCAPCNLRSGAGDLEEVNAIQPRAWQSEALEVILEQIWRTGVATINAAPGAGKTIFAGLVFLWLAGAGLVSRIIVVVPNLVLVDQWKVALGKLGIHIDTEPRDGYLEHPKTCGAVITYQVLPQPLKDPQRCLADMHRDLLEETPTLVVFDEVHHVAKQQSWGRAVQRMVGDTASGSVYPAGVLNMTGTLFRCGRDKRISTVRHAQYLTDSGEEKLQAIADYSIGTAELVGRELRAPHLYVYDTCAQLIDHRKETVVSGRIGDLDKQQRATALRGLDRSPAWLYNFASEALRLLDNQLRAIRYEEPLKLLYCATDVESAKLAAEAINRAAKKDFARLVHYEDRRAKEKLAAASRERKPCAIVQVNMASEGFDCPQVSTIAYASNVTADLRIQQIMARAMRLTNTERAINQMLPAQILIPDNSDLREVFAAVLSDIPRLIDIGDSDDDSCFRCGLPRSECVCDKGSPPPRRPPRYELIDLSAPEFQGGQVVGHDDGWVAEPELTAQAPGLLNLGVPEVYHLPVIVWHRRSSPWVPTATEMPVGDTGSVLVEEVNPRDLNRIHRAKLTQAAGWMARHIDHDDRFDTVAYFQYLANDAAGIPSGGRDSASSDQLRLCAQWMCDRVAEHCATHVEDVPIWVQER